MKVKLRTIMAGPSGVTDRGGVLDLADRDAYALIESGHAEQVDDRGSVVVEFAVAGPAETAEAPANRRARRRG